jgi:uncharacterized protein
MQTSETPKGTEHPLDLSRIAQDLQIRKLQVESVVQLLDAGNTVPFITRYRKERTGGLNEDVIRQIQARVAYQRQLAERKQTILKSIAAQGKLTDELQTAILAAETSKRLEDLYLPHKPKKRSLATAARERGLEPFATAIWIRDPVVANLTEFAQGMVNPEKELATPEDVLAGVQHLLAEQIAETADVRAAVRVVLWETGKLCTSRNEQLPEGQGLEYKDYFQFTEPARHIPPHRILAINRGEKANAIKGRLEWDADAVRRVAAEKLPFADHAHAEFLHKVLDDALSRLLLPSLEREIRRELTDEAEDHAVRVFARNLRSLLLQPPLRGRRVLAVDPGFRTGCKIASLDEHGSLLGEGVIYPFTKPKPADKGKRKGQPPVPQVPAPTAVSASEAPRGAAPAASGPIEAVVPATDAAPIAAPSASDSASTTELAVSLESMPAQREPAEPASAGVPDPAPLIEEAGTAATGEFAQLGTVPPAEGAGQDAPPATGLTETASAVAPPKPAPQPAPPSPRAQALTQLEEMIRKFDLNLIALGNGTACRETEELISELIKERMPDLAYVIVNEAGASVYSASPVGREEFPNYDATLRGTISIGRRLQDPLSELVKIDPQNVGVGLYQHDVHPRRLKESLDGVIESCVNHVGVDLNTASVPLLRYVSGLNQLAARELVEYRKQNGPFRNREQLLQVPAIGPVRFVQAAGFLHIPAGDNALDQTWVHPESYPVAQRLLSELGTEPEALRDHDRTTALRDKLKGVSAEELASRLDVGVPTLRDILDALARPGRDPREDLPPPVFKKGILKLEDLQPGMELKGTVLNVVDFGAFVDVGLKDSGLVHISQMANRYIKNPYDIVAVGDVVTVWVLSVDQQRRRVSLTMIRPGTERKPPEKKPQPHLQRGGRPPRGRRPPPARAPAPANAGHVPANAEAAPTAAAAVAQPAPAAKGPPPRPRKPYRAPPKPKLSQAALEGAAPLRTFSELKAFFEAQRQPTAPAPPPPQEETGTAPSGSP